MSLMRAAHSIFLFGEKVFFYLFNVYKVFEKSANMTIFRFLLLLRICRAVTYILITIHVHRIKKYYSAAFV